MNVNGLRKGGIGLSNDKILIPSFLESSSQQIRAYDAVSCSLKINFPNIQNDGFDVRFISLSCDYTAGSTNYKGVRGWKIFVNNTEKQSGTIPKQNCSGCFDWGPVVIRGLNPSTTYNVRVEFYMSDEDEYGGFKFGQLLTSITGTVTTLEEPCSWGLECGESCNEDCSEDCGQSSDCFYCLNCESAQCNGQWSNFSNMRMCALQNDVLIPELVKPPSEEINRYTCIWFSLVLGNDGCAPECSSQCMFSSSYPAGYYVCTKLEFYLKKEGDSDFYLIYTDSNASHIGAGYYCYYSFITWDLDPDTLYTIKVLSYNNSNAVNREIIQTCRTAAYPPSAEVRQITDRTAQIAVKNLSSNYIYLRRYDYYVNGTKWDSATDTSTGAKEFWHWLYGLTPNVEYTFVVKMYRSDTGDYLDEVSCKGTTHTKFEWDVPKVQGQKIVVTAVEWNRLIDYTNGSYNKNIAKVSAGGKITASAFNAIATVVGCATVTKDTTKISAKAFNDLRDAYNNGQST